MEITDIKIFRLLTKTPQAPKKIIIIPQDDNENNIYLIIEICMGDLNHQLTDP